MSEYIVGLTRLEKIAVECAVKALVESAPPGSPGQPLHDALAKLAEAKPLTDGKD